MIERHNLAPSKEMTIEIAFPDGEAAYSRYPLGKDKEKKRSGNGKGTREAVVPWGKAVGEDEVEHDSPTALAKSLGVVINGAEVKALGIKEGDKVLSRFDDTIHAFESQGYTVTELPKGSKLDKLCGNQTNPERRKRLEGLAGSIFRVAEAS